MRVHSVKTAVAEERMRSAILTSNDALLFSLVAFATVARGHCQINCSIYQQGMLNIPVLFSSLFCLLPRSLAFSFGSCNQKLHILDCTSLIVAPCFLSLHFLIV